VARHLGLACPRLCFFLPPTSAGSPGLYLQNGHRPPGHAYGGNASRRPQCGHCGVELSGTGFVLSSQSVIGLCAKLFFEFLGFLVDFTLNVATLLPKKQVKSRNNEFLCVRMSMIERCRKSVILPMKTPFS
jgi:hypothetical protein